MIVYSYCLGGMVLVMSMPFLLILVGHILLWLECSLPDEKARSMRKREWVNRIIEAALIMSFRYGLAVDHMFLCALERRERR
jgi:hypothetical protein